MKFKAFASGSAGNMYTVSDGLTKLMLEAGIRFKEIQKYMRFRLNEVDGVLISHSHGDHASAVPDLLRAGVDVYMLEATRQELELEHHRIHIFEPLEQFRIGSMIVLPFPLQHDVECVGFLIQDDTGFKMLYASDTYYVRYKFEGLNLIAVECNYSEDLLEESILAGEVPVVLRRRLKKSHMSLEVVKDFLTANDLSKVREIWLIHMSDTNGDSERFKREIQAITGKPTFIA